MTHRDPEAKRQYDRERSKAYYWANREKALARSRLYAARQRGIPQTPMPRGHPLGYHRKTTIMPIEHPTVRDLAWAAGFFEGEACFSRTSRNRTNGSTERITVRQMNREPLERLQRLFGGRIGIVTPKTTTIRNYIPKAINSWDIHGSMARGLLMTVYPFLSSARCKQVRAALHPAA